MTYQELINNGIKRLRVNKHLTQDKFAELTGMSVQGLRNLEQNKYQPTSDTVDNICKIFNITPFDLLLEENSKKENEILNLINKKLKLCSIQELSQINDLIDIIRKQY